MLHKIKQFFNKKPERKQLEIEYLKIDKYLNFLIREKMGELNKKVMELNGKIEVMKHDLNHELKALHRKSLMNPNIPQREIQIMEGNRDNYVKRITGFVNHINPPKGYLELYEYCIDFSKKLEALSHETQRNFFLLSAFFSNELKEINKQLLAIENKIIEIRKLFEEYNIAAVKEISDKLKEKESNELKIKDIESKIEEQKAIINEHNEKVSRLNQRKETIISGTDYRALQSFIEQKMNFENEIKKIKEILNSKISELDTALRKFYYKNPDKKILKEYLDDPYETLLKDEQLEIISIFNELKTAIINETIDLKDKKKENSVEVLNELTLEYVKDMQSKLLKLEYEKNVVQTRITHNSASLNLSEQEYWINNTESRKKLHEQEIEKLEKEKAKFIETNNSIVQKIIEKISELTNQEVKIIY